ncbi:MAG: HAMP domain-containing sensor histidine kinase [Thermodesulfobacteriota bacterium]
MSTYTIVQIGQINEVTQSILTINNRMIAVAEKLSDIIFSEVRYERKFVISKDEVFYNEFMRLKNDFDRYLREMASIADPSQTRSSLNNIKESFQHYQSLVHEELNYLKTGNDYSHQWFDSEKKKATISIIDELEKLEINTRRNTTYKIQRLHEVGTELRRMAMVATGAFLIFGIIISLFINRSITYPLSLLKKKTNEIGKGNFKEDLHLSSPPELADLAGAFNLMCNKLKELDNMKSEFFSSIAHELRNPLSTIKMGTSLLKKGAEGPITEGQRDLLAILEKEINRLIRMLNSLLDLSKMEAGMMSFNPEPKNIRPLIDQAIEEIGPLVEAKKINLEVMVTERLPIIKIDSERILEALRNIIGNAIKFTPEKGRVRISVRSIDHGVEVSVADTGPGIPAENLITIFEKFQQVTTGGSPQIKGTGLGLAIAKQIITHHGGKIWAESKPGHGSTFVFVLPA